eukprot:9344035-Alexandrium_andersonii.AAC.1
MLALQVHLRPARCTCDGPRSGRPPEEAEKQEQREPHHLCLSLRRRPPWIELQRAPRGGELGQPRQGRAEKQGEADPLAHGPALQRCLSPLVEGLEGLELQLGEPRRRPRPGERQGPAPRRRVRR